MTSDWAMPRNVTVVGLGYVGLPLALAFSKELPTTGFDVDASRIDDLKAGKDRNREVVGAEITSSRLILTADASCIADAEFIVVTVPTPVTEDHKPDLSLLESASRAIGRQLRRRSESLPAPIIVYESTTYPGCTEEFCGPIIESESGLASGEGFFLGYSPERTNFGDPEHTLETVIKVVSGQTPEVATVVNDTYGLIARAGTHLAPSIKTAEASKVIENVQRDLNIALFNELAMIFDRMDIQSSDVFDAAATKWNFHRYKPGLVGGHCIPVDPYYLTYTAEQLGYEPRVILGGRQVNELVPEYLAEKAVNLLAPEGKDPKTSTVLVLGATFKKDVVDIRNSKAIVLAELMAATFGKVHVFDPLVERLEVQDASFESIGDPFGNGVAYDVVVLAVAHTRFSKYRNRLSELLSTNGIVIDVDGFFAGPGSSSINMLHRVWVL
ncbi:nucleotide sugar dehydrogenase [Dehalococcoides mccartyi]|nr:nucleotide sugar dehydrogenase [Dehalococcoides mccartyi]